MRYRETIRSTMGVRLWLALGLVMVGMPAAFAQSQEEMDDVTMQMVTDEDELSGEVMREIELDTPVEMGGRDDFDSGNAEELNADVVDEVEGLQDDFSEDVITGSDDELTDEIGDVEDDLIEEDGDISVPIDDAIDDGDDLLGDTTDELEDTTEDTTDELEDTTDETTDELENTLDP